MIQKVISTARKAGDEILSYYSDEIKVYEKDDESPVTKADLAAHHLIIDELRRIDPAIPIISEESGIPEYEERKEWKKFWIVDPLDGTKEFIKKNGEFTVNIALVDSGIPVLGVVYIPARDRVYYAEKGVGSFRRDGESGEERIFSSPADKSRPLKVAASRSHQSGSLKDDLAEEGIEIDELIAAGSSLKFCLVAEGTADIYPRTGPTMEWDVAAGDCIYRHSATNGQHASPLRYNKPDLKNKGFLIGF